MGAGEVGLVVSGVAGMFVALLAFLGRNVLSDLRAHETHLSMHDTQLAVFGAARVHERVSKLEEDMSEIKGDVRVIRAWVDRQTGAHRRPTGGEGS